MNIVTVPSNNVIRDTATGKFYAMFEHDPFVKTWVYGHDLRVKEESGPKFCVPLFIPPFNLFNEQILNALITVGHDPVMGQKFCMLEGVDGMYEGAKGFFYWEDDRTIVGMKWHEALPHSLEGF